MKGLNKNTSTGRKSKSKGLKKAIEPLDNKPLVNWRDMPKYAMGDGSNNTAKECAVERTTKFYSDAGIQTFEEIGREIGALTDKKNIAYGDSFAKSGGILKILYPSGVAVNQYQDMLYIVRVLDKLFRIATKKDAFGENPAKDIAGYSILKARFDDVPF